MNSNNKAGHSQNYIGYYSTLKGKEVNEILKNIDYFSPKVTACFLHEIYCKCEYCVKVKKPVTYRGKLYNNPFSSYEFRFALDDEEALKDIIGLVDIKAKSELKLFPGQGP